MARRLGVPVDAILDRFTPAQFDELAALERVDHEPLERILEVLKRGFAMLSLAAIEPDDLDRWSDRRAERGVTVAPRQLGQIMRAHYQPGKE